LVQFPGLQEVAVVGAKDHNDNYYLGAYIVPHEMGTPPSKAQLRAWLKTRLPDHAIPSVYIPIDSLPRSPNGKVDRKALPPPHARRQDHQLDYIAPRNELEEKLAAIWEDEIGVFPIGVTDDFFSLGGDSLIATGVMANIEKSFAKTLPISTLLQGSTVAQLACLLERQQVDDPFKCLVALQPRGTQPRFFCVHGVGGEVLFLNRLAQRMSPDQPFYAFQMRGLNSCDDPATTIEEIAAQYVNELIHFQSEGPYYIGGYSLGATVAFEMAQQLTRSGYEVGLLALIDQRNRFPAFNRFDEWNALHEAIANIPWFVWDDVLQQSPVQFLRRLKIKLGTITRRACGMVGRNAGIAPSVADLFELDRVPERYRRLLEINYQAGLQYVPQAYPGEAVLIRARAQPLGRMSGRDLGWKGLFRKGLQVITIPGNHETILDAPQLGILARALQTCINGTQHTASLSTARS